MFFLTPSERKVLLFVGILILSGSALRFFNLTSQTVPPAKQHMQISLININTASRRELESVKGIGPVTASRIIVYRRQFGSFDNLSDLKRIKGLGDKKIENIKNQITFH